MLRPSKWSHPFRFSNGNFLCISYLFHMCYMPHLSHPPCTDETPQHCLSPRVVNSWHGYSKAKVTGEWYIRKDLLPDVVLNAVKPTYLYRHPTGMLLYGKCCMGTLKIWIKVSNCIWQRIPKRIFVALQTLQINVMDGVTIKIKILEKSDIKLGDDMQEVWGKLIRNKSEKLEKMFYY